MKSRWRVLTGLVVVALTGGAFAGLATASGDAAGKIQSDPVRVLRIYYQAPVLVRAGDRVMMPVQVVCATARGHACHAAVSLGVKVGREDPWRFRTVPASATLAFDLSGPAARAATSREPSVSFVLRARARKVVASRPPLDGDPPLEFYVTSKVRPLNLRPIPFGRWRKGRTVLALPWGSGHGQAGLALGRESPTFGPSSFHVDREGHVHLLDPLLDRLTEFSGRHVLGDRNIVSRAGADLAIASDGAAYVAQTAVGLVRVTRVGASGANSGTISLGPGVLSQVRAAGRSAYAEVLPLDAWIRVPRNAGAPIHLPPIVGRPLGSGGRLVRVGTERFVRLGVVVQRAVRKAVELRSTHRFGEVALAESDGAGGYVVVVRVWRSQPDPADQFQVVHITNGRVRQTFAVSSRSFAEISPLSRFRLGDDGRLYQLVTERWGMRIVRFELEGDR